MTGFKKTENWSNCSPDPERINSQRGKNVKEVLLKINITNKSKSPVNNNEKKSTSKIKFEKLIFNNIRDLKG